MKKQVIEYLSTIGRRGGKRSKRLLTPEVARNMVKIREARRMFKKYYNRCFWSFDPTYIIELKDVNWVAEQMIKNGDRELWLLGRKLCR